MRSSLFPQPPHGACIRLHYLPVHTLTYALSLLSLSPIPGLVETATLLHPREHVDGHIYVHRTIVIFSSRCTEGKHRVGYLLPCFPSLRSISEFRNNGRGRINLAASSAKPHNRPLSLFDQTGWRIVLNRPPRAGKLAAGRSPPINLYFFIFFQLADVWSTLSIVCLLPPLLFFWFFIKFEYICISIRLGERSYMGDDLRVVWRLSGF